jgi:lysyl-tRNA synthetase class 2
MIEPVFLTKHPISLSPLARANDDNKELTDRFQLVINGAEIINAYSELVDPQEQERRLLEQQKLKQNGDEEAMEMDYDYIEAMEYGMPPISGWGMGIDRLIQILTNSQNIKDCVMFPLMKPKD